ncbi:ATP-binding protein [Fictibacillus sp. NRS-1165]
MTVTTVVEFLPLINQVIRLLTGQASLNNAQIDTQFCIDRATVKCEENQLKKVFVNVIKNAIEAMPGGGKVTITVTSNPNKNLLIQIKDEGMGIADGVNQLFHPFFTTKENGKGLRLDGRPKDFGQPSGASALHEHRWRRDNRRDFAPG